MAKRIGEILLHAGALKEEDVVRALATQKSTPGKRLGEILVAAGRLKPEQVGRALAEQFELPFIQLQAIPSRASALLPIEFQAQHRMVPFRLEVDGKVERIHLAIADPTQLDAVEDLRFQINKPIKVYVAATDDIDGVLSALAGGEAEPVIMEDDETTTERKLAAQAAKAKASAVASSPPAPAPRARITVAEALPLEEKGADPKGGTGRDPGPVISLVSSAPQASTGPSKTVPPLPSATALPPPRPAPGPLAVSVPRPVGPLPALMPAPPLRHGLPPAGATPTPALVPPMPAATQPAALPELHPLNLTPVPPPAAAARAQAPTAPSPRLTPLPMPAAPVALTPALAPSGGVKEETTQVPPEDVDPATPPEGSPVPLSEGDLKVLSALEELATGQESTLESTRVKPPQLIASLIRLLIKKGVIDEHEFLDELGRK